MLSFLILAAFTGFADDGKVLTFGEPVKIEAGGEPISSSIGHASPVVMDFDGDGRKDLLVGQFSGGKLRVYLNKGTNGKPELGEFFYLEAGGEEARVPSG